MTNIDKKKVREQIKADILQQVRRYNVLLDEYTGITSRSGYPDVNLSGYTLEELKQVNLRYKQAVEKLNATLQEERKKKTQIDIDLLIAQGVKVKETFYEENQTIDYYISMNDWGAGFTMLKTETLINKLISYVVDSNRFFEMMLMQAVTRNGSLRPYMIEDIITGHNNLKLVLQKIKADRENKLTSI